MIPLPKDTRDVIGEFAEKVENRSLLFEKMVLPKSWGHPAKLDEANRFNVLRAATGGTDLLREQKQEADRKVDSPRSTPEVKEQSRYKSRVAAALIDCAVSDVLADTRIRSTLNFLNHLERAYPNRVETFVGTLGGKLLINLAGGVQENAGLSLDRCFGLPYIPGSAVKGITRHAALWDLRFEKDPDHRLEKLIHALAVFGFISGDLKNDPSQANFAWAVEGDTQLLESALQKLSAQDSLKGVLSFLPAYPSSTEHLAIVAEGLTPHTDPKTGKDAPPNPLVFPAVERGSQFGFAILANRDMDGLETTALIDSASAWLREGLTESGIGAKTSSGFGWFVIDPADEAERRQRQADQAENEQREREAVRQRIADEKAADEAKAAADIRRANLSEEDRLIEDFAKLDDQDFAAKAANISELPHAEQVAFFRVLASSEKKERRKQWKKKKPELWASLQAAAKDAGIDFPA